MTTRDKSMPRHTLASLAALLAPAAFVATWWQVRDDLPSRIATHFSLSGEADGYTGLGWFLGGFTGVVLAISLVGVVAILLARSPIRFFAAIFAGSGWLLALAGVAVLRAASGESDPTQAQLSIGSVLLAISAGAAAAALVWWLLGADARRPGRSTTAEPPYALGEHERAVWVGRAVSAPLRLLAGGALIVAGSGWVLGVWALVIAALGSAVALFWCSTITLRIDAGGLTAHYGMIAIPRLRVALKQVESADAVDHIRPLEWGGWGLRITPRGTGMIVRGGPGVVVQRAGRRDLAVSVDSPQPGVDLLRALQVREKV